MDSVSYLMGVQFTENKMKKLLLIGLVLGLAACTSSAQDEAQDLQSINSGLKDKGCTVSYAGSVRTEGSVHESRIFLTTCESTKAATLSENTEVQSGKTTRMDTSVSVDPDYKD